MNIDELSVEVSPAIYKIGIKLRPDRFKIIEGKHYLVPRESDVITTITLLKEKRLAWGNSSELDEIEADFKREVLAILTRQKTALILLIAQQLFGYIDAETQDPQRN